MHEIDIHVGFPSRGAEICAAEEEISAAKMVSVECVSAEEIFAKKNMRYSIHVGFSFQSAEICAKEEGEISAEEGVSDAGISAEPILAFLPGVSC